MSITTEKLLQNLLEVTRKNLNNVEQLKSQPIAALNWKQNKETWSILECVEHLNRYGDFYIPEITRKIRKAKHKPITTFKSSWLGEYFVKSVSYKEDLNKMKTFKSMNPLNSELNIETLEKFTAQQHELINLLNQAESVNLNKTKTAISISSLIKLRLGDTFSVLIYHNERHVKQIEKIVNELKGLNILEK